MTARDQAEALAAAGRGAEAVAVLERGIAGGEPGAMYLLALWRLFGVHGARDLAAAHRLLDRACKRGHVESIGLKAILLGNGTGCRPDRIAAAKLLRKIAGVDPYAEAQLRMSAAMRPPEQAAAMPAEILSERPPIRAVHGFLTSEECDYVTRLAGPRLEPSFVEDPATGRRIPHPVRTSSGMSFGPTLEDRVINGINRRLAAVTGTRTGWGEPLHVLRYEPGQQYRPHVDFLPGVANQRGWTVLLYLNGEYRGGETRFDTLGVEFRGGRGDALVFGNLDADGRPDPDTRHAGLPVAAGVKWLATRWIRQGPYHPWTNP